VKTVLPLGPAVIYDIEMDSGTAIKISQSRDAAAQLFQSGSAVHFAPLSPASCHVFPAPSAASSLPTGGAAQK
jgi:putative spermidine/putrescine transport system ATP-binding protein